MQPTKPALQQRTVSFEDGAEGIEVEPRWWVGVGRISAMLSTLLVLASGTALLVRALIVMDGWDRAWGAKPAPNEPLQNARPQAHRPTITVEE